jgi:hypothetical protein
MQAPRKCPSCGKEISVKSVTLVFFVHGKYNFVNYVTQWMLCRRISFGQCALPVDMKRLVISRKSFAELAVQTEEAE